MMSLGLQLLARDSSIILLLSTKLVASFLPVEVAEIPSLLSNNALSTQKVRTQALESEAKAFVLASAVSSLSKSPAYIVSRARKVETTSLLVPSELSAWPKCSSKSNANFLLG